MQVRETPDVHDPEVERRFAALKEANRAALVTYLCAGDPDPQTSAELTKQVNELEARGWVKSEWGLSENNRRARYYTITESGRKHLFSESQVWLRYASAVGQVLRAEPSLA